MITEALMCLALNIYHEARGEPLEGQIAVAAVTLNRVADPRWPDTVCEVVYQPYQFSWTINPPQVLEPEAFALAQKIAQEATQDPSYGTHYHATHVRPSWSRKLALLGQIGDHRFYD